MDPFTTLTSSCVVLPAENVDTDQIIPARFLKTIDRRGLGAHLFADWRVDEHGQPRPDFPLNSPDAARCRDPRRRTQLRLRLVARARTVGAARLRVSRGHQHRVRRHLPQQRAQDGLLPVALSTSAHSSLLQQLAASPRAHVTIDLETQTATLPDGTRHSFTVDPFARHCLLNGVDELGFLLELEPAIAAYESTHSSRVCTR